MVTNDVIVQQVRTSYLEPMVESTKIWRTDGLNAEFLRGRFIDFSYAMHTHDKICLSLITDGAIRIRMRGQEFTARKGDLYAIDADVPHAGSPVDGEGWSLRTLYVDFDAVNEWVCDNPYHSQTRSISGPIIRDPLLTDMFSGLHVHAEASSAPLVRGQAAAEFADYFLSRHVKERLRESPGGTESKAVRRAREFLMQRLDEQVSLQDIAAVSELTPYRIYRAFQKEVGMTPHEFQRQARISLATSKIRNGESLAGIAAEAGFTDQAHFTRSFYRQLGVTPGVYRDAHIEGP